jgi:hypothetical protein
LLLLLVLLVRGIPCPITHGSFSTEHSSVLYNPPF